ncbi:MAG TPA: ATP-binding protein [Azospirillum sp.]|nr:ATP-binding protein [Azospirillum sp.]
MRVKTRRFTAVQVLHLLLAASVLCPLLLYAVWAYVSYGDALRAGEMALDHQLDRVSAEAQRGFDHQRMIGERALDAVARTRSPADPKAEKGLHEAFKGIVQRHASQTLWLFDRSGRALASSAVFPARSFDVSDQDFFQSLRDTGAESGVASLALGGADAEPSTGVALRVADSAGGFAGVVLAAVPAKHFLQPLNTLLNGAEHELALTLEDGNQLPADTGLPRTQEGVEGIFRTTGVRDTVERLVAARRLDGVPVTALVSMPMRDVTVGWRASLVHGALFALPVIALLFGTAAVIWFRTQRETAAQAQVREALQRGEAAEEALRRAQRIEAMGQLTGGVAHDFNNLLQVIASSLLLVRMGTLDPRQQRALDSIEMAASRGESLTRQLLSFSRRQTVAPTPLDLREQLPKFLDLMRHSLRGNISVMSYLAPDLWPVHVDASELELAVLNLGVNARDAMPNGGSLSMDARNVSLDGQAEAGGLHGDFVALTVLDNGCGIPPEILPKVFEPFVTTKDVGKGTGLGLSQVYGFAQQAGGVATIASTPGRGTAVTLLLPRSRIAVARSAEDVSTATAEPVVAHGRRETILLVEDNLQIAEATSAVIENLGFTVVHAADAKAALEVLDSGAHIDLLFSDIIMPGGMTGLELARLVREHIPSLPIVLTTGYSGSARDATAEGFTILRKPYNFSDFSEIVRRMLPNGADEQKGQSPRLAVA